MSMGFHGGSGMDMAVHSLGPSKPRIAGQAFVGVAAPAGAD